MKYSILMPYYKRSCLLQKTLQDFSTRYKRKDFEVLLIEDYKNQCNNKEHMALNKCIEEFQGVIAINHIKRPEETLYNPSEHYNQGALLAQGEYLIITNPECLHMKDILGGFDKEFETGNNQYIICGCYDPMCNWKQHSRFNNRMLHWCNAISKFNYFQLGGFDANYTKGIGYEDDDFALRVRFSNLNIVYRDDLIVYHQYHGPMSRNIELWRENKEYFYNKWSKYVTITKKI